LAGNVRRMSTPRSLRLPAGVRKERIPTARGEFSVLRAAPAGGGECPAVVLVPGFTGSKEDFLAVLEPVAAAGYDVTALDQRGQYESEGHDDPSAYDVKALAEDLLSVVAAVAQAPVHLLGHSFGGLVVRAAALAEPSVTRTLTLLDSGPAAIPQPGSRNLELLVQAMPTTPMETIWAVKRQLELDGRRPPPADIEEFLRDRFLRNHPSGILRLAEQLLAEPDRVAEVAGLGLPCLVAFGAADDAWSPAVQREMAGRLGAEVVEIAGAAHSPAAERPKETAAALVDFWSRH
jgi:pimeloyl-ACP methyl ester carboxylesterase